MTVEHPYVGGQDATSLTNVTIPFLAARPPLGVTVSGIELNANKVYAYYDTTNDVVELFMVNSAGTRYYKV